MIPKGKTTYWLLASFLLIAALSISVFFLFRYFENKKYVANEQKLLLLRNNYLLKDLSYNLARIAVDEKEAKEGIKQAALLYRLSYGVFLNGGIVPERTGDPLIPPAEEDYMQAVKQNIETTERIQNLTEYITETPYFLYRTALTDTIINGRTIETGKVRKEQNRRVVQSISELKLRISESETVNSNLIKMVEEQRARYVNFQLFVLMLAGFLIPLAVILILYLLNTRVFGELKRLTREMSAPKNAFDKELQIDSSGFFLKDVFLQFNQFRNILPALSSFIKGLHSRSLDSEPDEAIRETPLYSDLTALRNDLQRREQEEQKRRKREKMRQWAVEGRTKITNILQSTGTISDLADRVIVGLVKYLDAAQGGIFLLRDKEEEEPYLEMVSAFAYDRKKFLKKRIPLGEGLLGMAALERTTYWLKEIPKDYVEIESGLGDAPPKSLIIVPLRAENEMPGVMEIASFSQFEEHETEFIKDIAQSIGSSLRSVQIAEQTTRLLEESRKKSEELALQDAQMRKRFDELREAQRLAKKNEMEMSALVNVIDRSLIKCELNMKGFVENANRKFFVLTDYHEDELKHKDFRILLYEEDQEEFDENLKKVSEGQTVPFSLRLKTKFDNHAWVLLQMAPVRNDEDKISNVLLIGNDISRQKEIEEKNKQLLQDTLEKAEKLSEQDKEMQTNIKVLMKTQEELMKKEFELKALFDAVQTNYLTAELDDRQAFLWANDLFLMRFNIAQSDLQNHKLNAFIAEDYSTEFDTFWESALTKDNHRSSLEFINTNGQSFWLYLTLSPVTDDRGRLTKIVMIASDISLQKTTEAKVREQAAELREQEELMQLNMQEMMDLNESMQKELDRYKAEQQSQIRETANENDIKYFNWIDDLFS